LGFLFEPFVGGGPGEGSVWSIVVVVVPPFLELVVEEVDVADYLAFREPVELFGVEPVRSVDLAIQAWCGGPDIEKLLSQYRIGSAEGYTGRSQPASGSRGFDEEALQSRRDSTTQQGMRATTRPVASRT
jgi:hypothetical protein